ncbi:TPA: hypothetical protein N0F65_012585 [Lagenidium giganteum]|uniref:Regulator of telomere elongation helicase 1 homolog n=1 Tax=Lagenidium giganteum TaxID=4803 RepID=A0AAV2YSA8_9STRA|nr:TPA: hypothetical protein N0F65_012585 [Lagenidium giganteum]
MVLLDICGVEVDFPFQPYDSQLIYMEKVVTSLLEKQNAILESPTGTGKTLCLLCAALGWRRHVEKQLKQSAGASGTMAPPSRMGFGGADLAYEDDDAEHSIQQQIPRIIYSSRTHSQLKQVVQELKNTTYKPRVAVLGSREHLCVNAKVSEMRGTRQNLACRAVCKSQKCEYKHGFEAIARRKTKPKFPIMDIEELVETMKERKVLTRECVCPFFLSRTILPDAEIVFVPYNYLIDPVARRSIGISIENSVLVFDEAHNVESVASDAASFALSSNDIAASVAEVNQFLSALKDGHRALSPQSNLSIQSVETLRALLLEIDKGLNEFPLSSTGGLTKPGEFIFEFFQQFNVNFDTVPLVLSMIEEIIEESNAGAAENAQRAMSKLDSLLSFLSTIFRDKQAQAEATAQEYRVHIQETQERQTGRTFNSSRKAQTTRVFNYWCFHPGVSFKELCANKVFNIILTSGTLSPLETTIKELGIDFPVRLENNHVIDASQVWVGVVGTGVTGKRLNSSYNFRSSDEYQTELGNTLVNFARLVPNGLLVFFPSYSILEQSIEKWQRPTSSNSESIWDRILKLKEIFVEPRARLDFKTTVDEYHESIKNNKNGAVFFAVCRGKVSEGIDFSNEKGRAVVITGLPFPPTKDPKIILKKSILDGAICPPGEMKLTGNSWYVQQASRAVNQAIGRVIRHRHDFGAIILCDERFGQQQQQKCLSKWLQPYYRVCKNYGEAHIGLMRFFKANAANTPAPAVLPTPTGVRVAGLLKKSTFSVPKELPQLPKEEVSNLMVSQPSSQHSAAIVDGQSYINPDLLPLNAPAPLESKAGASYVYNIDFHLTNHLAGSTYSKQPAPPPSRGLSRTNVAKQSLNSMLSSSSSAIVSSTSSISRPFVPPKPRELKQPASAPLKLSEQTKPKFASEEAAVARFPSVARTLLSEVDVSRLYELIKQLSDTSDVSPVLREMCELLRPPERVELLLLIPKVLSGPIGDKFRDLCRQEGLLADESSAEREVAAQPSVTSFFERLQHKRKRKHHEPEQATILKDPQCIVCYDISRKAYAAQCGHICCMSCWKKLDSNGVVPCPVCKATSKLDQLSVIRAPKRTASNE